ncbi:MAG: hypothetical protein N2689_14835, partial [Verrucomicrobiae bacterium]|nr:hypothetical protein [Verrucomicrobiae bacterium]
VFNFPRMPHDQPDCTDRFERAVRCMWRGLVDLKPLITHRHKAADAQQALELAAEHRDDYIKGVLTF